MGGWVGTGLKLDIFAKEGRNILADENSVGIQTRGEVSICGIGEGGSARME